MKDNALYFTEHGYLRCEDFLEKMAGKTIIGKYQSNNYLVELSINGQRYVDNNFGIIIFQSLLISFIGLAVLRVPIHWLFKKYV